ncbi:hypothetical protein [Pedobacter mendelii]|uniref:Uncharacterized protein n=1 Tax=Pedobacter mendelii TaxID=1908240 RepID=A0ABQ2BKC1_9SPHI|nr:hypothetical protein [Pedobacter mendelii]GGI28191.1 hypothetical protein GCM10008119_31410 [Pedobacter mendelii]
MHIFAHTDTRIIDLEGTIIIFIGVIKSSPTRYRVMIDGVDVGFLEDIDDVLTPTTGSNIRQAYIDKIAALRNAGR